MPRETKAERTVRLEREDREFEVQHAVFLKELPKTMYMLRQDAVALGLETYVSLLEDGSFSLDVDVQDVLFTLNNVSDVSNLTEALQDEQERQAAKSRSRKTAARLLASLTSDELAALREHGLGT